VSANLGIVIREEPDGGSLVISRVADGGIVQLLGEEATDNFGNLWLLALNLEDDVEGWIQADLVVTATPQGDVVATETPTATEIPPTDTATPPPTATSTATNTATSTATSTVTSTVAPSATP
jgi:hypothetical protein